MVASRLGQLLGAPILRGAIVYVPDEIIPPEHKADGATPGFHFAVARMEGENFVAAIHYNEIENTSELPLAAVHLAWLAVGDQEGHNQYLQRLQVQRGNSSAETRKVFRLIDMGQMFGDCNWSAASVANVHAAYRLPQHMVGKLTADSLSDAIASVQAIDASSIGACFADYPIEWGVTSEEAEAATTRVVASQATIRQILQNGNPALSGMGGN